MKSVQAQLLCRMTTELQRAFVNGLPDGFNFPSLNFISGEIEPFRHNRMLTYKLIICKGIVIFPFNHTR